MEGIAKVTRQLLKVGWPGIVFVCVAIGTAAQTNTFPASGNVGIGTTSPGAALEVNGNVRLIANSGASITFQDGTTQSTAYTGVTCGGDYADSVDVSGEKTRYEPGDVLVLTADGKGDLAKSAEPYSTPVAGIYSTRSGTMGRRHTTDSKTAMREIPMAMVGIVPTKVSAENGPIRRGDLLVTASFRGQFKQLSNLRAACRGAFRFRSRHTPVKRTQSANNHLLVPSLRGFFGLVVSGCSVATCLMPYAFAALQTTQESCVRSSPVTRIATIVVIAANLITAAGARPHHRGQKTPLRFLVTGLLVRDTWSREEDAYPRNWLLRPTTISVRCAATRFVVFHMGR